MKKVKEAKEDKNRDKGSIKKKKSISISVLVTGLVMLIVGVVLLVINLIGAGKMADAEYLVAAENWVLEDAEGVIWDFTKIGEGTLTTDDHTNDYDFIWAIKDDKLLIETDWLYELENEYEYSLDQGAGVLTLKDGDSEYRFVANR
ncbi:MAG: hypothetical protein Q4F56_02075 [Candidatus Saccharibacteria bacterium]|nr:hypothetical protein [Candidatus Saccharibacteria bacterium]